MRMGLWSGETVTAGASLTREVRAAIDASTEIGTRKHPERVEVVLADPDRVHPELVGVQSFGRDVTDELVRTRVLLS